jgi:two-component system, OmpR family, phosphate regulon sensor histidine kinase PhoR
MRLRGQLQRLGSYALIAAIIVGGTSLAYYSYRYAEDRATRGAQSVMETTRDLAEEKIARIEHLIGDSDRTLFNLVDLRNLKELLPRWTELGRLSPTVESVIILDDRQRIAPDGYVSKKRAAEVPVFRRLFETEILRDLALSTLKEGEYRYLHREYAGRYYLLSYTVRLVDGRRHYIVLEADLAYLVGLVFPEYFAGVEIRRVYQIVDERDQVVFGFPISAVTPEYMVTLNFPTTLTAWRLRMALRDASALVEKDGLFDSPIILIVVAVIALFGGVGVLLLASRKERLANQLKSDFIANVSHELKTPLSLIRMFGELLATGRTKGAENAKQYAEIITRESERLARLIDNVLDFARIERGKAAYEFAVGDLAEVLSRGLDVYRYRLERENMKLTVEIQDDLPPVRMDENAMTLVLLNLVDNAVKYAADGKELRVSLRRVGERIVLAVADRGPGISHDEQGRIFERFYRARTVRNKPVRGSGIGLSLIKHIAEAHGGGVEVASKVGHGSTFTVWIPVTTESEPE